MMKLKHKRQQQRPRQLDRKNASKDIVYDAGESASSDDRSVYKTRSLDLFPLSGRTSFRIEGTDGEVDQIFRYLGLGPEDFSISVAAWEARKSLSPSSKASRYCDRNELSEGIGAGVRVRDGVEANLGDGQRRASEVKNEFISPGGWGIKGVRGSELALPRSVVDNGTNSDSFIARVKIGNGEAKETELAHGDEVSENELVGIRGSRPPILSPPPAMVRSVVDDTSSTWDIFKAFGPQDDHCPQEGVEDNIRHFSEVETSYVGGRREDDDDGVEKEQGVAPKLSPPHSSDDGNAAVSCDYTVSPNSSSLSIKPWQRGDFLGSGSFGTVYEGFTDNGNFFAVKEVSLLYQGSQGQQSLSQLGQEISLLSQFQHENIVRYLGTDRDEAKLYIFLELVPKGSLAALYGKYQLRDSQVSVYTKQILSGLNYLHCRGVVHRDIKCANILVDVSGSVKLADFGLAKATKLNDIKSCKGTPFWMAPEVVKRRNDGYGRAADIWSLGCTVLEMLTRQIPYSHLEGMQALFRIGKGELPPIPNTLSRDAEDFILRCLQVNPDDRPTAAQLLEHPFVNKQSSTFPSPMSPH